MSVSLGLTMETAFGTLRASTSRVSVDQRNASTQPRPSPWSRADWLDWRLVQNQELTARWPCWETLETFTHGAFGLTSTVSRVHTGSGNTPWRFYPKNSMFSVFSTWNVLFLLKPATLMFVISPVVEDKGLNMFKLHEENRSCDSVRTVCLLYILPDTWSLL